MKIKKGDKVKIMLGKDRGKEGTVEYVMAKENKLFVGGANLYKRHIRRMQGAEGGIIDLPKPIDASNVSLICPNCKKLTKIGFKTTGKDLPTDRQGKLRICKKCKKELTVSKGGKS